MVLRLALLYAVSSFVILSLSFGYLYGALGRNLKADETTFFKEQMHFLKEIIHDRPAEFEEVKEKINLENSVTGVPRYFMRVLDDARQTLTETRGMPVSANRFPEFLFSHDENESLTEVTQAGKTYLLFGSGCRFGNTGPWASIQLAADISTDNRILLDYGRKLAGVLVLGVFAAGFAGALISRRGLLPLKKMAEAAQKIHAENLQQSICEKDWPEELQQLAVAFEDMLRRLEKSFTQISRFSADLAHELRTPVNNLIGETEVILSKPRDAEDYQKLLGSNLEEYEKLSKIIESMLFLARAENTEIPVKREPLDLAGEVDRVKDYYGALAEEKGLTMSRNGEGVLFADPTLFRRVLTNLISNAIKHADRGQVTVEIMEHPDHSVELSVSDMGPGISPADLPHIFDPFYRVDPARSSVVEGTGLGLAIVKSIMNLHRGSVTAESVPGQGTRILLFFPPHLKDDNIVI